MHESFVVMFGKRNSMDNNSATEGDQLPGQWMNHNMRQAEQNTSRPGPAGNLIVGGKVPQS